MLIAFSMCIINLLVPSTTFRDQMGYIVFWGITTITTLFITVLWGKDLVDTPKLYSKIKKD